MRTLLLLYLLFLLVSYLTFVAPGESYVRVWLNDVMGLLDIANRVQLGQTPYQDFHTMYGPLVAFVPALGLTLGLPPGVIFGFSGVVSAALLLFVAMTALPRRLTTLSAVIVFTFAFLLIVVPIGETQGFGSISWGTFYNRQGWAALILILMFYLEPVDIAPGDKWWDAIALTILVLFELYNKFTFATVAIGFVVACAFVSPYARRVSLISIVLIVAAAGLLEMIFPFLADYYQSITRVVVPFVTEADAGPSGDRLQIWNVVNLVIANAAIITACIGVVLAARAAGRRSVFDLLFATGAILSTIFLHSTIGTISLVCSILLVTVFLVIGEAARRVEHTGGLQVSSPRSQLLARYPVYLFCLLLALMFMSQEVSNRLIVWQDFASKLMNPSLTVRGAPRIDSILVPPEGSQRTRVMVGELTASIYMQTINDGIEMLRALDQPNRSVVAFDMVNPFPYAADMRPPVEGVPLFWIREGKRLPVPERFLGGVDYVMVPRLPYQPSHLAKMKEVYGTYLRRNYALEKTSRYWNLWMRKTL